MLDLVFGPFVVLGLERVTITPGVSPGFSLDHIDWSHSLLMSAVWATVYGLLFTRWGARVAWVMGIAAFSHFLLDLPMHPPDLALWPGSDRQLGAGLWQALPQGWWWLELTVVGLCGAYYFRHATRSSEFGRRPVAVLLVVLALHAFYSPWLSPLR